MSIKVPNQSAIISMAFTMMMAIFSAPANAQSLKEQIVGTWLAVSQYVDQDGKKLEPFGTNPKGIEVSAFKVSWPCGAEAAERRRHGSGEDHERA
ncbi:MAG: hypothetical protein AB3X44_20710 [Leptothrix sp. (in: b-proteobacteria)]